MAGAGVGEGAGGRVEDGIKSSDERSIARVGAGEVVVEIVQQLGGRRVGAGLGVGDGVGDGHEYGGGRAVVGDVGDEQAHLAAVERKKIVVVAAGAGAGLV